jgi:predicted GTPase
MRKRIVIMGAAGKDFHVFNTKYRNNEFYEVVGFTATQIPHIGGRTYPPELSGPLYPDGIPVYEEKDLSDLIKRLRVDKVVFGYSDVSYEYIRKKESMVREAGADFILPGTYTTMIPSKKPLIAVCAVRTGCGKSQTTRRILEIIKDRGKKGVVIRHPMPYGELVKQNVQRFATLQDLHTQNCTIEEMEEYEPHIERGNVVFAGVDYEQIVRAAEAEADVIVWDGGNNDTPFYKPDLHVTVLDPHRAGHELLYHPGKINFILADVLVLNKLDSADEDAVNVVLKNIGEYNPKARLVRARSPITVHEPDMIWGQRVLVVEDGPTLTHGDMKYGAGILAAKKYGAREIVDPRPFLVGSLANTFKKYPGIGSLLPAMGYGKEQILDLEATINGTECDTVIVATPINLRRILHINKPSLRVTYDLEEIGSPDFDEILDAFIARFGI